MSLIIHHLHLSQSERIVWLCEELIDAVPGFQYQLELHSRDPTTAVAPAAIKQMHLAGTAPIMLDTTRGTPVKLTESQAIVQYIIDIHGSGHFVPGASSGNYADFLQWVNFANGSLQAAISRIGTIVLFVKGSKLDVDLESIPIFLGLRARMLDLFTLVDQRLEQVRYLAGEDLTAADIMTVFSLTTIRGFFPIDLDPYPNILRYLNMIAQRPAYLRALAKAEDSMEPMIQPQVQRFDFLALK